MAGGPPGEPLPIDYNLFGMNVVVITLRGCPVTVLGPYGNEWIATPNLDRLAAEGVVFDRHFSECPDPDAASRAWRTGRNQIPHFPSLTHDEVGPREKSDGDVRRHDPNGLSTPPTSDLHSRQETGQNSDLLNVLKAHGVYTVLVRNLREEVDLYTDFYAGWDKMFDARPAPADRHHAGALLLTLATALNALSQHARWLLWIETDHLLPPWDIPQDVFEVYIEDLLDEDTGSESEHDAGEDYPARDKPATSDDTESVRPWSDPPTGWFDKDDLASWELLHRSFAAVVTTFDADLGRLFELLRERGLDRSAKWVLTSDRGLPLGEHGMVGYHRPWLHEELVHVPLIVRLPDGVESGRRVSALTQPADLMPTLLSWFGIEVPPLVHGVNLTPLMHGQAEAVRSAACSGLVLGPAGEWAIRTLDWALLVPAVQHPEDEPRGPMLFEKPDDRWEVNDLRPRNLERAEELEAELRKVVEQR
jgi:arylsulfatase A-like enzyme